MNKNGIFVLIILVLSAFAQLSLISGVDWMQFARSDISSGQWWRLITGNFVHLTWRHFAMNAVALMAIYALYPSRLKNTGLSVVFLICCLFVTFGIWIFSPEIQWYVGLSGALHGLLISLIILDYMASKHFLNIVLMFMIIAKLVWEGMMGPLPGSELAAGGPVVSQAHAYGVVGGIVISICLLIFNRNRRLSL